MYFSLLLISFMFQWTLSSMNCVISTFLLFQSLSLCRINLTLLTLLIKDTHIFRLKYQHVQFDIPLCNIGNNYKSNWNLWNLKSFHLKITYRKLTQVHIDCAFLSYICLFGKSYRSFNLARLLTNLSGYSMGIQVQIFTTD